MKPLVAAAILLTLVVPSLRAQNTEAGGGKSVQSKDANCGILYGKGHVLTFCAPKGWVLDNSIWNDQGIYAVFYPAGSTFESAKDSATIMYINVAEKNKQQPTVQKLMADDAEDAKQRTKEAIVARPGDPIQLADMNAPVQLFAPGEFSRDEAVAYLDSPKVITMFVISSKDAKHFKSDYPAFAELVRSYKFLSSEVKIEHK